MPRANCASWPCLRADQLSPQEPPSDAHPQAILIAGPTASGKSATALALAERLAGTILNADSMQVYRELAILTARPNAAEQNRVAHRLYGMVPASEAYSVGQWLADVSLAVGETRNTGTLPILVGGTGLYFKALLDGLAPIPDIPPDIRLHWRAQEQTLGPDALHEMLAETDPAMAARLRPTDSQRVVRALEVIGATGVSLSEWQETSSPSLFNSDAVLKIVIAPEREQLYAAIDARFERMVATGALDEARIVMKLDLSPALPAMRAHGVRELTAVLAGTMSEDEAIAKVKTETRRYAKRQMTWARRYMADWHWVPDAEAAVAVAASAFSRP